MTKTRWVRLVAGLFVLSLVVAACSSDDDDGGTTDTTGGATGSNASSARRSRYTTLACTKSHLESTAKRPHSLTVTEHQYSFTSSPKIRRAGAPDPSRCS